jgi:hypothetical protein
LLGFSSLEELRDVFGHPVVWRAADGFEKALAETRERDQPDEFALAWAIEKAILAETKVDDTDVQKLFNDPAHHTPPPEDLAEAIVAIWEERPEPDA